jgi:hypothetical protein
VGEDLFRSAKNLNLFSFREEQQWDETVNTDDSDDETEQV